MKKTVHGWCNAFQRGIQRTEQCLGQASQTEINHELQRLMAELDVISERSWRILEAMEKMLKRGHALSTHEYIYQNREKKTDVRTNSLLQLGNEMMFAGRQFGESTTYGQCLMIIGKCEEELGQEELRFVSQVATVFLAPLRRFMETDLRYAIKERRVLATTRLDLDASRQRLKKAQMPEKQAHAEAVVRSNHAQYERQLELTKLACESIQHEKINQIHCLLKFIDAQMEFCKKNLHALNDVKLELTATLKGEKGFEFDAGWPTLDAEHNRMPDRSFSKEGRSQEVCDLEEEVPQTEPEKPPDPPAPERISEPPLFYSLLSSDRHSLNGLIRGSAQGRVKSSFTGKTASEVSVVKNEFVEVFQTTEETTGIQAEWSLVKRATGQMGYVPTQSLALEGKKSLTNLFDPTAHRGEGFIRRTHGLQV